MQTAEQPPSSEPESPPEPDRASMLSALRELEAAQARVERDAQRVQAETREKLVAQLLPVLDNLDRTIFAAGRSDPALVQGVRLVRSQLEGVLRGYGLVRVETKGLHFDPKQHEAISVVPVFDLGQHNLVLEQAEPGYMFGDRLLRPAKVVVGRATR